jgi:ADP-heptose:LPS heptosyltransferase
VAQAYSLRLPASPQLDRHAVAHSLAPLQAVGITTDDQATILVPSAAQRRDASDLAAQLLPACPFWALHPGAGKRQNCWPAERFADLAQRASRRGHAVLVLHGPADAAALATFQAALPESAPEQAPIVIAPALPLGTGAALLDLAERFLCNDTGIMHVAGALQVPTLALFGPTDPTLWKPPADAVVALRASSRQPDPRGDEYGWMESLTADAVWSAWQGLPARRAADRV